MRERINQDIKEAMRSGDKVRLSTLRLVNAAIKDRDIAARVDGKGQASGEDKVDDSEILALFQKLIKMRRDSIESYTKGGRTDLADKERAEIEVIESYLPKQMSEAEIKTAVESIVAELEASSLKDMGRTMATLKERYMGQMDFSKASAQVKSLLAG